MTLDIHDLGDSAVMDPDDAWGEPDERDDPEVRAGWMVVGELVRARRKALGWSQRDVWRATGITQPAISRLENGRLRGLRWARFGRLVSALGGLDPDLPRPPRPRTGWW
jgi:hypothetical protein